jgi:hypothetical protein
VDNYLFINFIRFIYKSERDRKQSKDRKVEKNCHNAITKKKGKKENLPQTQRSGNRMKIVYNFICI